MPNCWTEGKTWNGKGCHLKIISFLPFRYPPAMFIAWLVIIFFSHFFFTSANGNFLPYYFCQNRKRGYRDLVYAQYAWQSRRRRRRRYASWVPGFTVYTYIGTVSSYHRARSNTILPHVFTCLWGRSSFRHYGSNVALYHFFNHKLTKVTLIFFFELFEKSSRGCHNSEKFKNKY